MEPAQPAGFILSTLTALLGGMLIGLERERAQARGGSGAGKSASIPGMRSFGLISVYGAVSSYVSTSLASNTPGGSLILPLTLSSIILVVALYAYTRMVVQGTLGITTYIVMFITFFVGFLAGQGLLIEASSLSVVTTLVLALKRPAERLARTLRYDELLAMLEVAALALVLGPIVKAYSQAYDVNIVFKVYAFFTIVLILSFTSYAAARIWGVRGVIYAAILGSLVNSEAAISSATSIISEIGEVRHRRSLLTQLTLTIVSVLQVRASLLMILAVYIFSGTLNPLVVEAGTSLALVGIVVLLILSRRVGGEAKLHITVENPLSWSSAFKSAAAYLLLTAAFLLTPQGGAAGLTTLALSFLGGLVNATATILSLATALASIGVCKATAAMLTSIAAATVNKILYADTSKLTSEERRILVTISLLASTVPAGIALIVLRTC